MSLALFTASGYGDVEQLLQAVRMAPEPAATQIVLLGQERPPTEISRNTFKLNPALVTLGQPGRCPYGLVRSQLSNAGGKALSALGKVAPVPLDSRKHRNTNRFVPEE